MNFQFYAFKKSSKKGAKFTAARKQSEREWRFEHTRNERKSFA